MPANINPYSEITITYSCHLHDGKYCDSSGQGASFPVDRTISGKAKIIFNEARFHYAYDCGWENCKFFEMNQEGKTSLIMPGSFETEWCESRFSSYQQLAFYLECYGGEAVNCTSEFVEMLNPEVSRKFLKE